MRHMTQLPARTRLIDGVEKAGAYCRWTLVPVSLPFDYISVFSSKLCFRMDDSKSKADTFLYGNGLAHQNHITRQVFLLSLQFSICDAASRFQYAKYLALCKSKNVKPRTFRDLNLRAVRPLRAITRHADQWLTWSHQSPPL